MQKHHTAGKTWFTCLSPYCGRVITDRELKGYAEKPKATPQKETKIPKALPPETMTTGQNDLVRIEVSDLPSRNHWDPNHLVITYKLDYNPEYRHKLYFDNYEAEILKTHLDRWLDGKVHRAFVENIPDKTGHRGTNSVAGRENHFEIISGWHQDRLYFNDKQARVLRGKIKRWLVLRS